KLTAALLFIIGPLAAIVGSIPLYSTANVSATNIFRLEETLASSIANELNRRPEAAPPAAFGRIELRRLMVQYADRGARRTFRLGPVDLTSAAGETVFIVGGNGSGKSTLLKTLTALYHHQSGSIVMDDTLVTPDTATWYRSHFTPIFSDYHLFDRLYGLGDV